MNETVLSSDNPLQVRENLLLNDCWWKSKKNDNKIEQDKAQYDLDRQIANISALSSGNIVKY